MISVLLSILFPAPANPRIRARTKLRPQVAATAFVVAAAAPPQDSGFVQQVPAPKFAAQVFLLVGKDGRTYGRRYTKGDQPLLEFYDPKGDVIWSAPPSRGGFKPVQAQ